MLNHRIDWPRLALRPSGCARYDGTMHQQRTWQAAGSLNATSLIPRGLALAILGFVLAGTSCSEQNDVDTLTVFADVSLRDAMQLLETTYEDANPGVDVRLHFADSLELVQRLRDGATADLVVAASEAALDQPAAAGLLQEPVTLTTTSLVVATREGLAGFDSIEDLAKGGLRIAAAAPGTVAGAYADSGLDAAAREYGAEWRAAVGANLAVREADARAVMDGLESGRYDAGIVYRSDLTSLATDVAIGALPFPARLGLAVVYPTALTARPPEVVLAKAFLDFLLSDDGQALIESFGFGASQ